jgi:catechol 2,3-dioxygenase
MGTPKPAPGYPAPMSSASLPAETRPGPVRLQVADRDRSLAWYGKVLGMQRLSEEEGSALLGAPSPGADGPGTPLIELAERPGARPVPRNGRLGLFHFALLLPQREALGRFVRHLSELRIPAGASDHRVSEALYLTDPDGLGIEVYADRPRHLWARTPAGEVAMATDPLDLDDLVRAGGETPWAGVPAGTVMGHLHLHVGDLEEAEAFYHAALGLQVMVRGYPGALFLSAGGYHHHLGVNTWARGAAPPSDEEARLLRWELLLPSASDLDAALDRLESAGHTATRTGPGEGRVQDPWGTVLGLRVDAQLP